MEKARILIVEDEKIVAEDLQSSLEEAGYQVVGTTGDGSSALSLIATAKPDLVLMDIMLGGRAEGTKTAEAIWQKERIPVVFLTAYADEETLAQAKKSEPFGYVVKPYETRELLGVIEMAMAKYQTHLRLQQNEAYLKSTLNSIGDGVITLTADGNIEFMNPVAEAITGWRLSEVSGKPVQELITLVEGETGEYIPLPWKAALRGVPWVLPSDACILQRTGRRLPVEGGLSVIRDDRGKTYGVVWVLRDISERLQIEKEKETIQEQLYRMQKMEAIGTLIGSVAHDFNNLLTAIQGCTEMALIHLDPESPAAHDLQEVRWAAGKAADVTRKLLLFSRKHPMKPVPVDVNKLIGDLLKMLHRLIGEGIGIRIQLAEDLWHVMADPGTLEQVILNLVLNARDAMPNGGRLTIQTENVTLEASSAASGGHHGDFVRITVSDTGVGIPPEIKDRLFEPFFTTKEAGKGTGLGLSVVYGIVTQHRGFIEVESEPGQGATFRIYLPATKKRAISGESPRLSLETLRGKGERILIVEDSEGVRLFAEAALGGNGYRIRSVATFQEAIHLLEEANESFDLVFSDVVLPDESGVALIERVKKARPTLPVLLTSGYTDQKSQWALIQKRGYRFLQKPYTLYALLSAVHELLHPSPRGND